MNVDNRPWSTADIGQNAIGSVLHDPTSGLSITAKLVVRGQFKLVSKQALVAIPRTNIKHVKLKDFDRYIGEIKDVFERYSEARQSEQNVLFDDNSNMNQKQKLEQDHVVEAIPEVFMESDFNLENPLIFNKATEFANVASAAPSIGDKTGATTNSVLQEKLSHYLDFVEVRLVTEISKRSVEFFSALSNIQSLHTETTQCLEEIRLIRNALLNVSTNQAIKGLEVVRRKKRRNNLAVLYSAIKMVKEVKKTQPMIQVLLSLGDYVGALDLIAETNKTLKGNDSTFADTHEEDAVVRRVGISKVTKLTGVRGLVHLTGQLAEMTKMIGSLIENDFVTLLTDDITGFLSKVVDPKEESRKWANSLLFPPTGSKPILDAHQLQGEILSKEETMKMEDLKIKLKSLMMGLLRMERLGPALQAYRDRLLKIVKNATKQYLPPPLPEERENMNKDSAPNDGALAKRFRLLTFDGFLVLMESVYLILLPLQKRILLINELLKSLLLECETKGIAVGSDKVKEESTNPTMSLNSPNGTSEYGKNNPAKYTQFINDVSDILFACSDLSHVRCGKLLTLRGEQTTQLNFKDFLKLFEVSWKFVVISEWICQRTCIGLKGTLMTQAKSFVSYFHMERLKQSTMLIDNEQWIPVPDVPIDFQMIVNKIAKVSNMDIKQPSISASSTSHLADLDVTSSLLDKSNAKDDDDDAKNPLNESKTNMRPNLILDGKEFIVVNCVLMYLKMTDEYLSIISNIPSLTPEVINRLFEITKMFNTRVCGVIVGGAAVHNAVLKSITAKHLAIAGQSLGFLMTLLPHIQRFIEQELPPKQQIMGREFERILEDYKHNQEQIFSRVVSIMEERLNAHCMGIHSVIWDRETQGEGQLDQEPNEYMKNLIKETVKLHKILRKVLFPETVKILFADIFQIYSKKLETELSKIDLYSSYGKNLMLVDVQYYIKVLSSLDFVDGPGSQLEVAVNNIRIRDRREKPKTPVVPQPDRKPSITPSVSLHQTSAMPNLGAGVKASQVAASQAVKSMGTAFTSGFGKLVSSVKAADTKVLGSVDPKSITKPVINQNPKAAPPAHSFPVELLEKQEIKTKPNSEVLSSNSSLAATSTASKALPSLPESSKNIAGNVKEDNSLLKDQLPSNQSFNELNNIMGEHFTEKNTNDKQEPSLLD